ncbi:MAG: 2-amino-4-hydroxy-6-hydroxymethyldihydropteridine diphosphokinase [Flammeovirgaceae bacterium]|nr:2-amino-4-hydroxy-6-hydroxymethyldihydropteridine diphosphokinase [Flammeovirgaceae bacterium]
MADSQFKRAFLLIGSNLGNRKKHLLDSLSYLKELGNIESTSSIYQTAAWGKVDQNDFLNQAVELHTELSAKQLLEEIFSIEKNLGRIRNEKWSPRTIDIDILFYDNQIIEEPDLKIPHPEIQNRKFALMPMAEIAPHLVHPQLKKNILALLKECKDPLNVVKF